MRRDAFDGGTSAMGEAEMKPFALFSDARGTKRSRQSGVYAIVFASGKQYIGSAVSFERRWQQHRNLLQRNAHRNIMLQRAFNKHLGRITFTALLVCRPEHVIMYEQCFLDVFKPEYNICKIAGNTSGYTHSPEAKRVIGQHSRSKKRPLRTESHRKNLSAATKGVKKSPRTAEHIERLAASIRGRKSSDELRLRLSIAHRGKKQSAETIAKRVASLKQYNKQLRERQNAA